MSRKATPTSPSGPAAARQSGPGTPYYRAYRRFDQEFHRTYRPNEAADRSYYDDQEKRNDKYFQALREPDPRKRSQLLREYNLDNMRAARDLSSQARTTREPPDRFTPGVGVRSDPEDETDEPLQDPRGSDPRSAPAARRPRPARGPRRLAPPLRRCRGRRVRPRRRRPAGPRPSRTTRPPAPPAARTGRPRSGRPTPSIAERTDGPVRLARPIPPRSTAPPAR